MIEDSYQPLKEGVDTSKINRRSLVGYCSATLIGLALGAMGTYISINPEVKKKAEELEDVRRNLAVKEARLQELKTKLSNTLNTLKKEKVLREDKERILRVISQLRSESTALLRLYDLSIAGLGSIAQEMESLASKYEPQLGRDWVALQYSLADMLHDLRGMLLEKEKKIQKLNERVNALMEGRVEVGIVHPYSYIVFKHEGEILAQNGSTGKIDFMGSDALQKAIDATTEGTIHLRPGKYPSIKIKKSWITLEGEGNNSGIYGLDDHAIHITGSGVWRVRLLNLSVGTSEKGLYHGILVEPTGKDNGGEHYFSGIVVQNVGGDAIHFESSSGDEKVFSTLVNGVFGEGIMRDGIYVSRFCQSNIFINIRLDCRGRGIFCDGLYNIFSDMRLHGAWTLIHLGPNSSYNLVKNVITPIGSRPLLDEGKGNMIESVLVPK